MDGLFTEGVEMRAVRILFSLAALLVVIGLIAITCIMFLIDPNQIKPYLIQTVADKTGYQLKIDGKLTWSIYPQFGVKADVIYLAHSKNEAPFLELHQVSLAAPISMLFKDQAAFEGDLYATDVKWLQLNFQNVYLGLHWKEDELLLEPIDANAYEGTIHGRVEGYNLHAIPRWNGRMQADKVQLKPFFAEMPMKIKLAGIASMQMQATSEGKTLDYFLAHLNGEYEFDVVRGAIEGLSVGALLQSAEVLLSHQSANLADAMQKTPFDTFSGSYTIENGLAETKDLLFVSSMFRADGLGRSNLVNQTLDYQLQVTPLRTFKFKWDVPVLVTGTFADPNIRLDMMTLKSLIAKETAAKISSNITKETKLSHHASNSIKKILGHH